MTIAFPNRSSSLSKAESPCDVRTSLQHFSLFIVPVASELKRVDTFHYQKHPPHAQVLCCIVELHPLKLLNPHP